MSVNNGNIRPLTHCDNKGISCQNYDRSQIGRQASPLHTPILLWILLEFKTSITTGTDVILAYNKPKPLQRDERSENVSVHRNQTTSSQSCEADRGLTLLEEAYGLPGRAFVGCARNTADQDKRSTESNFPKEEPFVLTSSNRTKQNTH